MHKKQGSGGNQNQLQHTYKTSATSIKGNGAATQLLGSPDSVSQFMSEDGMSLMPKPQTNKNGSNTCNCKKSKCLKLYCDCFAFNLVCGPECNCQGCANVPDNEERRMAVESIVDRNPLAFQPKIENHKGFHSKGCHCKKSGCQKKYCECYQSGVVCTELCICDGCKNCDEALPNAQLSSSLGESHSKPIASKSEPLNELPIPTHNHHHNHNH